MQRLKVGVSHMCATEKLGVRILIWEIGIAGSRRANNVVLDIFVCLSMCFCKSMCLCICVIAFVLSILVHRDELTISKCMNILIGRYLLLHCFPDKSVLFNNATYR